MNTKSGLHGLKRNKERILKSKKANVVIIVSQYSLYPSPPPASSAGPNLKSSVGLSSVQYTNAVYVGQGDC